ncbi:hypothetical protein AHAS_Ahas05G0048100 [Arachis hypogaea]
MMDHNQSTQMGYVPRSHNDQASYMGYFSPSQNDSSYYTNCGWGYQDQGMMGFEQSNQMGYFPRTQNNSYSYEWDNYPNCNWEGQTQSEFNFASTQNSFQNPYNSIHQPQNSFYNSQNSFHTPQNDFTTKLIYPQNHSQPPFLEITFDQRLSKLVSMVEKSMKDMESIIEGGKRMESSMDDFIQWSRKFRKEQDITFKNIEVHIDRFVGEKEEFEKQEKKAPIPSEIPMKKEEVLRVYKPRAPYPQRLLRVTKEHANSLPKKAMQDLTKEREENNQGSPHSNEIENCMEDDLIEPSIQEVLDEEDTPTITQHLSLAIKEVKAIKKST